MWGGNAQGDKAERILATGQAISPSALLMPLSSLVVPSTEHKNSVFSEPDRKGEEDQSLDAWNLSQGLTVWILVTAALTAALNSRALRSVSSRSCSVVPSACTPSQQIVAVKR